MNHQHLMNQAKENPVLAGLLQNLLQRANRRQTDHSPSMEGFSLFIYPVPPFDGIVGFDSKLVLKLPSLSDVQLHGLLTLMPDFSITARYSTARQAGGEVISIYDCPDDNLFESFPPAVQPYFNQLQDYTDKSLLQILTDFCN